MMVGKKAAGIVMGTSLLGMMAGWGTSSAAMAASNHVTITYMDSLSTDTGPLKTGILTLIRRFEKAYPNITVKVLSEAGDTVETKLEASVAAGDAPTVAQVSTSWIGPFIKSGVVVPLTSYVNGKMGLSAKQKAAYWNKVWAEQFVNGVQYMMPFNQSDYVMYYNASWLKKDHIPVPKTWTEFFADLKKVTSTKANTWGLSIDPGSATAGPANGTFFVASIAMAYGGQLYNAKGLPTFDTAASRKALQMVVDAYKAGYIKLGTEYPGQAALGSEHSPFDMSTVAGYTYNLSLDAGKFPLGVAPFPVGPSGEGNYMSGNELAMFSSATPAQRQAAWLFMKWLTLPAQQAYWATTTGYLAVNRAAFSLPEMKRYDATHPIQSIAAHELQYAAFLPPTPGFSEAMGAFANAIQEATVGHESVGVALKKAQAQAVADIKAAEK
jgi:multiple sugar transport system substrate-binding protein